MAVLFWFGFDGLAADLLVLRQVRTLCHSQLISSSVGVRSRQMSSRLIPDSLTFSRLSSVGRVPACGVLVADWLGAGGLEDDWWRTGVGLVELFGVLEKLLVEGDDVDEL